MGQAQSPVESWRHKRHVTPPSVQLLAASQQYDTTTQTDEQAAGEIALLMVLYSTSMLCVVAFNKTIRMRTGVDAAAEASIPSTMSNTHTACLCANEQYVQHTLAYH
jgi:hypothetical protein